MKLVDYYKKEIKKRQVERLTKELAQCDEIEFLRNLNDAIDARMNEINGHFITGMFAKEVMDKKISNLLNIQEIIKRRLNLEVFS